MFRSWLKGILFRWTPAGPPALNARAAFLSILGRERLRHDRNGGTFALLTITLGNPSTLQNDLNVLAELLRSRLRSTDEIGILAADRVGAVLPDTTSNGAYTVAEEIGLILSAQSLSHQIGVLVYPFDEAPPGDDDGSGGARRLAEPLADLLTQPLPVFKRLVDIVGASVGLVLCSPLLLMVAAAIKLTSRGPVLYTQLRAGLGGRPFKILKFRTMVVEADQLKPSLLALNEQDGPAFKIQRDPRVTRIGRLLRTTSIDELPQLWNVLRGEMSLVGPRPLPVEESGACAVWQHRRLEVTPGLTCIWQVEGRSSVSFDDWMRMDMRYIRKRTLWQDLLLMLKTIPAVLRNRAP